MHDSSKKFLKAMDASLEVRCTGGLDELLDRSAPIQRYVVGRNPDAQALALELPIAGVIDDWYPHPVWNGLPVVRMHDIESGAIVVNCSTSISPVAVGHALASKGIRRVVNLADILRNPAAPLGLIPQFVREQRADYAAHREEWAELYDAMADSESRRTLTNVLGFRLTADPTWMSGYQVRIRDQYFEEFLSIEDATFVDAGGFDGDTTQVFCDRYPGYRKVFLLEPSPANMAKARTRLSGYRDINFLELGLSDAPGEVAFDADAGSASVAKLDGSHSMRVVPLDQAVLSHVSFIKMDLEGWEMPALRGGIGHLEEDQPELAIAVYHHASDFRDVFRLGKKYLRHHRVHLRHYTQGWSETVLYFSRSKG